MNRHFLQGFAKRDLLYLLILLVVFFLVGEIRPHTMKEAHLIYLPQPLPASVTLGYIQGEHWLGRGESLDHAAQLMQAEAQKLVLAQGRPCQVIFQPLSVLLTNPDVCVLRAVVVRPHES